ncbi:MAG TPA: hypothetical protein VF173_02295 [Thermoanaerobaculia bacterium]|nr:hypothetical protein [Thermoanaerobaculia bacterium]
MQEILSMPGNLDNASRGTLMQLNPFALAAETRGRFRMLVVAAVAAAFNISLSWTFLIGRGAEFKRLWEEYGGLQKKISDSTFFKLTLVERETLAERADTLIRTLLGICLGKLLISILYVVILSTVAILIYRRHPQRIRRQFRALPLTEEKAPTVARDLKRMVDALNLSPAPSLEVQSLEHSQGWKLLDAIAFGLKKSPALLFRAPAEVLEGCWNTKYKAIVLHELAHIKAGDAQDRERAKAIWLVLGVFGYLPMALVMLSSFFAWLHGDAGLSIRQNVIMCAQLVMTLLVVFYIMAGLIRIREFYADGRVAIWGWQEPLAAAFRPNSGWWHPPAKTRKASLERSENLLRISSDLPLETGMLLALVLGNGLGFGLLLLRVCLLLGQRLQWHVLASLGEQSASWKNTSSLVPPMLLGNILPQLTGAVLFFFLARLVSGTLDLQVQREAVADLATRKHENWGYLELLRPACLFAIGFEAGLLLAPDFYFIPPPQWLIPARATAMTLLSWLWLVSMRAFSRFSFGSHAADKSPEQGRAPWFSALILTLLCYPLAVASFFLRGFQQNISAVDFQPTGLPRAYLLLEVPIACTLLGFTLLYVLIAGSALVQVSRSLLKVRSCPICGDSLEPRLVVGRVCQSCSNPLTPWLYPHETDRLQIASKGEVK